MRACAHTGVVLTVGVGHNERKLTCQTGATSAYISQDFRQTSMILGKRLLFRLPNVNLLTH